MVNIWWRCNGNIGKNLYHRNAHVCNSSKFQSKQHTNSFCRCAWLSIAAISATRVLDLTDQFCTLDMIKTLKRLNTKRTERNAAGAPRLQRFRIAPRAERCSSADPLCTDSKIFNRSHGSINQLISGFSQKHGADWFLLAAQQPHPKCRVALVQSTSSSGYCEMHRKTEEKKWKNWFRFEQEKDIWKALSILVSKSVFNLPSHFLRLVTAFVGRA